MTNKQARLVEENHNLIYGFLHKHKLSEDFYGDAAIGLCKAAETFDETKNSSFSTYAYKCMFNECGIQIRLNNRSVSTISFETPVMNGEDINLESMLPNGFSSEHMESISYMKWFVEKMCLLDLRILLYRLQGDSYRDVAKKVGYSSQSVKNRLTKMGEAYKEKSRPNTRNHMDNRDECKRIENKIFVLVGV